MGLLAYGQRLRWRKYYYLVDENGVNAARACTNYDDGYRIPNVNEMIAMLANRNLIKSSEADPFESSESRYWTSTPTGAMYGRYSTQWGSWVLGVDDFYLDSLHPVWCIKR